MHGMAHAPCKMLDIIATEQFDVNGNTGGCQDTYTVIPPLNNATCPNITLPSTTLGVNGVVINGPMSRYGWINQVRLTSYLCFTVLMLR
jgi:hypothetical protein